MRSVSLSLSLRSNHRWIDYSVAGSSARLASLDVRRPAEKRKGALGRSRRHNDLARRVYGLRPPSEAARNVRIQE